MNVRLPLIAALLVLAACGGPALRVVAPQPAAVERLAVRYPTIEIREITLPSHAANEEIFVEGEDGLLVSEGEILWSDEPARATTLGLTRALLQITGATVAPEPWPFDNFPAARVDVRVEDLFAGLNGSYRMTGQAFVAPLDGRGRDRALAFDLVTPLAVPATPQSVAAARTRLISDLAMLIARDGLR